MFVKKKSLLVCAIMIAPFTVFSQKKTAIQPFPAQKSLSSLNNNKPGINKEYEKALKEYEALLKKYPDKKELYYNLGNLNYLSGDTESALKNYQNSLIDSETEGKAHTLYNMGNALYQMGDIQKSVKHFKEALTLVPEDEDIRYNYELSKRMLEQQSAKGNKDQNQDGGKENAEQNKDNLNQQSEEGEKQEQKSASGKKKDDKEIINTAIKSLSNFPYSSGTLKIGNVEIFNLLIAKLDIPKRWKLRLVRHFWREKYFNDLLKRLETNSDVDPTIVEVDKKIRDTR